MQQRYIYNTNIYKAIIIPDGIYQTNNKLFVTVNPKNTCKLEFSNHLWLIFIDQPQSDVVVISVITFQIYKMLVTKLKTWNRF